MYNTIIYIATLCFFVANESIPAPLIIGQFPIDKQSQASSQTDCNIECDCTPQFVKAEVIEQTFITKIPADTNSEWLKMPIATINFRAKRGYAFIDFSGMVGNLDNNIIIQLRLNGKVLCGHISGKHISDALTDVEMITYPDVRGFQSISHRFFGEVQRGGRQTLEIFIAGCCSGNASNAQLTNPAVQIFHCR